MRAAAAAAWAVVGLLAAAAHADPALLQQHEQSLIAQCQGRGPARGDSTAWALHALDLVRQGAFGLAAPCREPLMQIVLAVTGAPTESFWTQFEALLTP